MIISKTPYRISLFGGGTDIPSYYTKHGGQVIGFTINKFSYLFLKETNRILGYKYRIVYSKHEITNSLNKIKHPSVRETLKYYNFRKPVEITHNGDLPALSGMGSSSSFTVGLCKIIKFLNKKHHNKYELANDAIDIEQNKIKEIVGSQDQTFAAFGGLNRIKFNKSGKIDVKRINLSLKNKKLLEQSSLLVFTGKVRFASKIEEKKVKNLKFITKDLKVLNEIVDESFSIFQEKKLNIKKIGSLLHKSWTIKQNLTNNVSNPHLNMIYKKAIKYGAYGGKLLGAGGGGFFYFLCEKKNKAELIKKLNLKHIDFKIGDEGSKIIFEN